MKGHDGVEVCLHTFLTWVPGGHDLSASLPGGCFTPAPLEKRNLIAIFLETVKYIAFPAIDICFVCCPADRLVTILTELSLSMQLGLVTVKLGQLDDTKALSETWVKNRIILWGNEMSSPGELVQPRLLKNLDVVM
jgi:hypothetical protein